MRQWVHLGWLPCWIPTAIWKCFWHTSRAIFFPGKVQVEVARRGGNSWEVNASTDSACESRTRKEAFRRELKSRNSKGMACFFPSSFFSSMVVALIRRTVCESAVYLVAGFWNVDAIFTVQWIFFEIGASIGRWLASKTAMRRWHIFFCNIALAPPELFPRHISHAKGGNLLVLKNPPGTNQLPSLI